MLAYEGVHPLEGGAFRLKFRRDRRHGMKWESPLVFYPRYSWQTFNKLRGYWRIYRQFKAIIRETLGAPDRWSYTDIAIAPPPRDELESMALYHETAGGEAAVARKRRDDAIRAAMPSQKPRVSASVQ
jgi:hypothetical protein